MATEPWWHDPIPAPDEAARAAAQRRQAELTKPPGSLGRLEAVAVQLAALQATSVPRVDPLHVTVFAADHGVAVEGVSAFPQAVTLEMVRNFARGGAAISVLARELGATLEVVDVGTAHPAAGLAGVIAARAGAGTANLCDGPAMTTAQRDAALDAGRAAAGRAAAAGAHVFIGGDMGIGNTPPADRRCRLRPPARAPAGPGGPGTGLDAAGARRTRPR
ncbi:MAG: nicotinate-nucleotide--dimethylbenzimidazole phosphoribosyltransferase [Halofilum sp. (in: g-proteobacteria)]|nr:nicotinate-nucleotide--dimethylbenzimidazole phosphoribosyltransferase [Halofilum sp. (in: g-proteobacteria)]